ncbi:terminase small subunit [Salmonella enterica]|nr:terminase small subunit [Salmonella enterica]
MTRKLKAKHEVFCREFLVDLNATQAAIRAGYSLKRADHYAYQLMNLPHIKSRINELKQERIDQLGLDANYVLARLVEIDRLDVADILNDDFTVKPLSAWPLAWRQYLSGFSTEELFQGRGDDRESVGLLKRIKWPDKVKNLELLGKHISIQAFKDNVKTELSGPGGGPVRTENTELTPEQAAELYKKMMS